jgi:hypothetical protein
MHTRADRAPAKSAEVEDHSMSGDWPHEQERLVQLDD